MDIEKIKELAQKHMANRKAHIMREKGFIYSHCTRTANLALNLRKRLLEDDSKDDIMFVGALFHDVAKGIEPHSDNGSVLTKEILKGVCTESELQEIAHVVFMHTRRKVPGGVPEHIKIVQDADILDHFGTMELWMNFVYQAYDEKSPQQSLEFYSGEFFKDYVVKHRELLNYQLSKEIYDDKMEFVYNFIKRFTIEANGGIY